MDVKIIHQGEGGIRPCIPPIERLNIGLRRERQTNSEPMLFRSLLLSFYQRLLLSGQMCIVMI